ncbi:ABC transporter substrate-binding protein [Corynebacterium poyangense]|nr:ABC transporter substrate-binding protein [Corynebacterium poyangense]
MRAHSTWIRPWPALLTCIMFVISSCSAGHTAVPMATSHQGNSLNVGTTTAMMSMDFTKESGAAIPQALMGNVYETLVTVDDSGNIQPLLATSWTLSPDHKTYTFHLRDDVHFSDGSDFTSHTAAFSIQQVKDSWINASARQMDVVDQVATPDLHTLVVTLQRPSAEWLWRMSTFLGAMMSPASIDRLNTNPLGTGPYQVSFFAPGKSIHFQTQDHYWRDNPPFSSASIQFFSDAVAATNALSTGDLDVIWALSNPELLGNLDQSIAVDVGTSNGEFLLSMNNQRAPFNDIRVRQAVMYAVNRQDIIDTAWEGYGTDTGGIPVAPIDPWYEFRDHYSYDPEKSRELLQQAGFGGKDNTGPEITISVPSLPYAQAASEVIYSQLTDVGFRVKMEKTEFPAVWLAKVYQQHDYDMSLIAHTEPRDMVRIFGDPKYYVGVHDPELENIFQQADSGTADQEIPLMKDGVERIMSHAYALTLMNIPTIVLRQPRIAPINPTVTTDSLGLWKITPANDEERRGKDNHA